MRKLILAACLLLACAAVLYFVSQRGAAVPPASGRIVAESSANWGSIPFQGQECSIVNNTWNRSAAGRGFQQVVFLEQVSGKETAGWRWRAPWHIFPRVVSQPEIICGNKPWDPPTRADNGFPFRAGSKHLVADFNIKTRAQGIHNTSFSLWAVSAIPVSKKNITHEIMIWTDFAGQPPAGKLVDSLALNGTMYNVYIEPNQKENSGENSNTWTYVAFVAQEPVSHGPLDISAFIDYLLRRGMLNNATYFTSLEFGNEISQGAGITEIQDFAINIR
jgi:Glycosyl hydrolase family 12